MDLNDAKIIPDVRLYSFARISKECGRRALERLEAEGAVAPLRTPTGRTMLSPREAEAVMKAVTRAA